MKNYLSLLVIVLIVLFCQDASAQLIPKGKFTAGISTATISFNEEGDNLSSFNTSFGYYVIDDLAVGLSSIGMSFGEGYSSFSLAPYARFYLNSKPIYIQAELPFIYTNFKGFGSDSSISFAFGAGYSFFFTENITVEPSFHFTSADGDVILGMRVGASFILTSKRNQ